MDFFFSLYSFIDTIKRSKFQIRDDMLREQSIAQEYWAHVIQSIKEQEIEENKQHNLAENF